MVLSLFCCFKKRTNQLKKSSSLSSKNSNNRDEPPNKVSLIRRQEKVMSSLIVNTKESFQSVLDNITYNDTEEFIPNLSYVKVIKVYDGDTITVVSNIFGNEKFYRFHCRLRNIDAPELKSKIPKEKELAKKSQQALSDLIMNKYITVKNLDREKWGRTLCDAYLGDINISNWMLENKYAIPYDGGKKNRPTEWD